MALNLIKLSVGSESVDGLRAWIEYRLDLARQAGRPAEHIHTTRMTPKRVEHVLDGGSMYWVIKGFVQARQRLIDIRPFKDEDGILRCRLVMDPTLVATEWQPKRPFQGWRYFKPEDVPSDLDQGHTGGELPVEMRRQLAELCLL